MTSRHLWPILLATGVAQAASLPLSPGTYVRADVTCDDPPFAATFDYDGHRFSYPHASNCRSTIVSRQGRTYRVRETCSALGDGSPARPDTNLTAYTIASHGRVTVRHGDRNNGTLFRRCPASRTSKGA